MELVSGVECARRVGVSQSYLSNLFTTGKVPGEKSESGKVQFDPTVVKAKLVELGYKPRTKSEDTEPTQAAAAPVKKTRKKREITEIADQDEYEATLDKFLVHLIRRAHKKSARVYREYLLNAAEEAKHDPDVAGLELKILRHIAKVDEAIAGFKARA